MSFHSSALKPSGRALLPLGGQLLDRPVEVRREEIDGMTLHRLGPAAGVAWSSWSIVVGVLCRRWKIHRKGAGKAQSGVAPSRSLEPSQKNAQRCVSNHSIA